MARSGRVVQAILGLALPVVLGGCGSGAVVVAGPPSATPYDGPLYVEVTPPPPGQDPEPSGAALPIVQCTFDPNAGTNDQPYEFKEAGSSPEKALTATTNYQVHTAGRSGLIKAREEKERVLFTLEVAGATKLAAIVRHGPIGYHSERTGWYLESWAVCDPAEFPDPSVIGMGDLQIWTDAQGERVPTYRIFTSDDTDCLPGTTWLKLDGGDFEGGQTYVRGAGPEYADWFAEEWVESMTRPPEAEPTGYSRDGRTLWLSPDGKRAYVGTESPVEMWPATTQDLGCA